MDRTRSKSPTVSLGPFSASLLGRIALVVFARLNLANITEVLFHSWSQLKSVGAGLESFSSKPVMTDTPAQLPPELVQRYRQLFRFYDRQGDGELELEADFQPAATSLAGRWQGLSTPFPDLYGLLMATYRHEQQRRDADGSGGVDEQEFVASHRPVLGAFRAFPDQARAFIERAAGGFFDVLDVDGDGCLQLGDLEAYALAYAKPTAGIAANLLRMLDGLNLPPEQPRDQLPRDVFLTLVAQYWFDVSPDAPGRWLFHLDPS